MDANHTGRIVRIQKRPKGGVYPPHGSCLAFGVEQQLPIRHFVGSEASHSCNVPDALSIRSKSVGERTWPVACKDNVNPPRRGAKQPQH